MTAFILALLCLILMMFMGVGFQRFFVNNADNSENVSMGAAVFLGMGLVLHVMNIIQHLSLSLLLIFLLTPLFFFGIRPIMQIIKQAERKEIIIVSSLLLLAILDSLLFMPDLPVIAWDSWLGWELKAKQWLSHGFTATLLETTAWLSQIGLYSPTAHYPDGLPLMYYLFQSLGDDQNTVMSYLYVLCYFGLVLMAALRLKKQGAGTLLLVWSVILLLTLPLLNNHMRLQGYADIWLAMVLLLSIWALSDWNQDKTAVNALRLVMFLSMLPLFKAEGWVWLGLLLIAQFVSKFLIRKHRWYVFIVMILIAAIWFCSENWSFSWAARTVIISQSYVKIGALFDMSMIPVDVNREIITGMFLQNNWGLLWYFMPFVFIFWLFVKHPKHQQVTQTFFLFSFAAFLFLFFFTGASKWAENYAAVNRIVLQLTPVFAYLVTQVFVVWQQKRAGEEPTLKSNIKI